MFVDRSLHFLFSWSVTKNNGWTLNKNLTTTKKFEVLIIKVGDLFNTSLNLISRFQIKLYNCSACHQCKESVPGKQKQFDTNDYNISHHMQQCKNLIGSEKVVLQVRNPISRLQFPSTFYSYCSYLYIPLDNMNTQVTKMAEWRASQKRWQFKMRLLQSWYRWLLPDSCTHKWYSVYFSSTL